MCYMKQINLRLPEDLLEKVDQERGSVARERWIRDLIEERVDHQVRAPEPTPSKPLPEKSARQVIEEAMQVPPTRPVDIMKEKPVATVIPQGCSHPRSKRQSFGWGTLCGICGVRL